MIPATTHPVDPPWASAAGLTSGDGVTAVGDGLVGVGDGLDAAYVKVMPPSIAWPSWETTR